jgi:hypothetical protein
LVQTVKKSLTWIGQNEMWCITSWLRTYFKNKWSVGSYKYRFFISIS